MFDFDDLEENLPLPAREKISAGPPHILRTAELRRTQHEEEEEEDDLAVGGPVAYAAQASGSESDSAEPSAAEFGVTREHPTTLDVNEDLELLEAISGGGGGGGSEKALQHRESKTYLSDATGRQSKSVLEKPKQEEWWQRYGLGEQELDKDLDLNIETTTAGGTSECSAAVHIDSAAVTRETIDQAPWRFGRSSYEVEALPAEPVEETRSVEKTVDARAGTAAERYARLFQGYGNGADTSDSGEENSAASSGMDAVQGRNFGLQTVLFKIVDDVLPMHLDRERVTPQDATGIWEEWGVAYAARVRFEAPAGSATKWLNAREDFLPGPPAVIRVDGKPGILQAISLALKQRDTYARDLTSTEGMERRRAKEEFRKRTSAPKTGNGQYKERIKRNLTQSFFVDRRREQARGSDA